MRRVFKGQKTQSTITGTKPRIHKETNQQSSTIGEPRVSSIYPTHNANFKIRGPFTEKSLMWSLTHPFVCLQIYSQVLHCSTMFSQASKARNQTLKWGHPFHKQVITMWDESSNLKTSCFSYLSMKFIEEQYWWACFFTCFTFQVFGSIPCAM